MSPATTVTVIPNWSIEVEFDKDSITSFFDGISENIDDAISDGIFDYLEYFRDVALANKPWEDRSGALRKGHIIEPTDDGWKLTVDATIHGTATWKGKAYNYAYALEQGWLSSKYKWIEPTVDKTEDDLVYYVENSIQKLIDSIEEGLISERKTSSLGKQYTMLRYPSGSIDPISGKKIGGRFVRKL